MNIKGDVGRFTTRLLRLLGVLINFTTFGFIDFSIKILSSYIYVPTGYINVVYTLELLHIENHGLHKEGHY